MTIVLVNYIRSYIKQYHNKQIGIYFYTVQNGSFESPIFETQDPQSGMLNEQIFSHQVESNQVLFLFRINQQTHLYWMNKQLADYAKI